MFIWFTFNYLICSQTIYQLYFSWSAFVCIPHIQTLDSHFLFAEKYQLYVSKPERNLFLYHHVVKLLPTMVRMHMFDATNIGGMTSKSPGFCIAVHIETWPCSLSDIDVLGRKLGDRISILLARSSINSYFVFLWFIHRCKFFSRWNWVNFIVSIVIKRIITLPPWA